MKTEFDWRIEKRFDERLQLENSERE